MGASTMYIIYIAYIRIKSKKKSKPSPLSHGDRLKLGATVFMVHIHVGTETCDQCEPGQLQQAPMIDCGEHMYCKLTTSKRHYKFTPQISHCICYSLQQAVNCRTKKR